jgi:DNA invertase Pin-like site-specific DNA recombinase
MAAPERPSAPEPEKIPVIAIVRVSTPGQAADEHGGIPRQHASIARAVAIHRLEVVATIELVISGTQTRGHPQIIWMRQMLADGQVKGVVVSEIDRIMRPNTFADYELLDSFITVGAKIYVEGTVHDYSEDMAQLGVFMKLFFGGMERRGILKKTNDGRRALMEQGAHVWGARQLPLGIGYDRKSKTYSLTTDIAKIQEAFRLVDEEGLTNIREVGRRLGIKERTLHRLLRNPIYSGRKVYEFTRAKKQILSKSGKLYHPKVALAAEKRIEKQVMEPAIPLDRWSRVQAILEQKGKPWKAKREILPQGNILRGLTFCSVCGERLYLSGDPRRPKTMGYYYCSKNYYRTRSKSGGCGAENQRQITLTETTIAFAGVFLAKPETVKGILRHALSTKVSTVEERCRRIAYRARRARLQTDHRSELAASRAQGSLQGDPLREWSDHRVQAARRHVPC